MGWRHALRINQEAAQGRAFQEEAVEVFDREACKGAREEISGWPGYRPTPLYALRALARDLGLGAVWYKDESRRFGLGSFKALGGAYGVLVALRSELGSVSRPDPVRSEDLLSGRLADRARGLTVACASAGNHGRAVAWGAQMFGARCVVYLPADAPAERAEAITGHGARIVRTAGDYDAAVRAVAREAKRRGWLVVSDTATSREASVPRAVMHGYTLLAAEALDQLGGRRPTHVFVQAGVGGLAAAVCAHLWAELGPERPTFTLVEANTAASYLRSFAVGRRTTLPGPFDTAMGCLACGEPSWSAWRVLRRGAHAAVGIPDEAAAEAMRRLARAGGGDPRIVAGQAGAAGLGGLLAVSADGTSREALDLSVGSAVLLIGTEGALDRDAYRAITGVDAGTVTASQDCSATR